MAMLTPKLKMIRHETTTVMWSECTACVWYSSRYKNNYFVELRSSSEEGSYVRLINSCITQF